MCTPLFEEVTHTLSSPGQVVAHSPGGEEVSLLASTAGGQVTAVRLRLPPPLGDLSEALVLDDDGTGAAPVVLSLQALDGGVTSLDVGPGGGGNALQLLIATRNGLLATAQLGAASSPATLATVMHPSGAAGGGCSSFASARFVGRTVAATVGSVPGCACYDVRGSPTYAPAFTCHGSQPGRDRFGCLAVEGTAGAYGALIAAGSTDSEFACVWDIRAPAAPLWTWRQESDVSARGARVTAVGFDISSCFSSSGDDGAAYQPAAALGSSTVRGQVGPSAARSSGLLIGTSQGRMCSALSTAGASPSTLLARECSAIAHCAVEPSAGQQLAAVTDGECLLLWDASAIAMGTGDAGINM
jgi:hypothetical protein